KKDVRLPCTADVMVPRGLAGTAEAVELAFQRLDVATEPGAFESFRLQVSYLTEQLEKLTSKADMIEARKGFSKAAAADPQIRDNTHTDITIVPTPSCPASGAGSSPCTVVEAAAAAPTAKEQETRPAASPQGSAVAPAAADQQAAVPLLPYTPAQQQEQAQVQVQPQALHALEELTQPPMQLKKPQRQLPPQARNWSLQDCQSWARDQEWSSWAEVQAFAKTLEPTLAKAVIEGSLERNPVVVFGKQQAEAPAICYLQLQMMELCGSSTWGTASITPPSREGPRKRRPFVAAFLEAAKKIMEPSVPQGGIRL
ncbi:hypothetical protein Vretimale_12794, partial [Volvox reticuliferus]